MIEFVKIFKRFPLLILISASQSCFCSLPVPSVPMTIPALQSLPRRCDCPRFPCCPTTNVTLLCFSTCLFHLLGASNCLSRPSTAPCMHVAPNCNAQISPSDFTLGCPSKPSASLIGLRALLLAFGPASRPPECASGSCRESLLASPKSGNHLGTLKGHQAGRSRDCQERKGTLWIRDSR